MNRVSKLFKPMNVIPKDAVLKNSDITSKSQRLMLELGVIRQACPGNYHLLPLGVRALDKLTKLVDAQMQAIDAQKLILPTLTSAKLWEKSGRLDEATPELFQLQDRHKSAYILSPTHEEAITDLLSSVSPLSYKHFPIKLYQITNKYRDEMKPRFGLIRSRQFLMKDLYTFDIDEEKAKETYETVSQAYENIFEKIGIEFVKVFGTTGNIGGSLSHEYHYVSDIGEDKILLCNKCNYSGNLEVSGSERCPQCANSDTISIKPGIEVGHTFLLGEKYSKPLQANFLAPNGKPSVLQMGCFGLGLTRILAAAVEVLSHEYEIRWPTIFAPYKMLIIPPKAGSKEELHTSHLIEKLYHAVDSLPPFKNDVLLDDRSHATIGKRFLESKRTGYPYIVAIGSKAVQDPPLFELNDLMNGSQFYFTETELLNYVSENSCNKVKTAIKL